MKFENIISINAAQAVIGYRRHRLQNDLLCREAPVPTLIHEIPGCTTEVTGKRFALQAFPVSAEIIINVGAVVFDINKIARLGLMQNATEQQLRSPRGLTQEHPAIARTVRGDPCQIL